jgi:hypothetical protein
VSHSLCAAPVEYVSLTAQWIIVAAAFAALLVYTFIQWMKFTHAARMERSASSRTYRFNTKDMTT